MSKHKVHNDDVYEGPSKTIEVLGKGNAYGWIGSGAGLAIGAVVGIISSNHAEAMNSWFKRNFHFNKTSGKTAIVVATALIGSQIGHWVTYAIGLGHGKKIAGRGQAQFERVKAQRDQARGQIAVLKEERDSLRHELAVDHKRGVHYDGDPKNLVQASTIEASKQEAPAQELSQ